MKMQNAELNLKEARVIYGLQLLAAACSCLQQDCPN